MDSTLNKSFVQPWQHWMISILYYWNLWSYVTHWSLKPMYVILHTTFSNTCSGRKLCVLCVSNTECCLLDIIKLGDCSWWRHRMKAFSALLDLCAGNSPVTGKFPSQRPVTLNFDVFFWPAPWINGWVNNREAGEFVTPSRSLWRH